jgi:rhodanese-related sulfurtransferase
VILGALFHPIVANIIAAINQYGWVGLLFLVTLFALYVLYRLVQRVRVTRFLRGIPRLAIDELAGWNEEGRSHVVLDVRPAPAENPLPGALSVDLRTPVAELNLGHKDTDIVVYCACPNEISAALLAMKLREAGYPNTWALLGGHDAWLSYRENTDSPMMQPVPEQA